MLLENQVISTEQAEQVLDDYIRTELKLRSIWDR